MNNSWPISKGKALLWVDWKPTAPNDLRYKHWAVVKADVDACRAAWSRAYLSSPYENHCSMKTLLPTLSKRLQILSPNNSESMTETSASTGTGPKPKPAEKKDASS